jgi:hypothetical protein
MTDPENPEWTEEDFAKAVDGRTRRRSHRELTRDFLLETLDPHEPASIFVLAAKLRLSISTTGEGALWSVQMALKELLAEGLAIETAAGFIRAPERP